MTTTMDDVMKERVEQLVDYIMKKCLWQFHSRSWDRRRQNQEILRKTKQILCGEPVNLSTLHDRCYWVDALGMAEAWRKRHSWINEMKKEELAGLMDALHARLDYLTIDGSLNLELTDKQY